MAVVTTSSTTVNANIVLGSSESLYIAPDVVRVSTGGSAIQAQHDNHEISIQGHVYGDLRGLLLFDGTSGLSSSEVTVGEEASVIGRLYGIQASGDSNRFVNRGVIEGLLAGIDHSSGDDLTIVNYGSIDAPLGAALEIDGGDATIRNFGQITGEMGLRAGTEAGAVLDLLNTGTIVGTEPQGATAQHPATDGAAVRLLGEGAAHIVNSGLLDGDVQLNDGDDVYDGRGGTVNGLVYGAGGNDTYIVDDDSVVLFEAPGGGVDTVRSEVDFALGGFFENLTLLGAADLDGTGNASRNVLTGNAGDNGLAGDGSRDTIDGGLGIDSVDGGRGDDVLYGAGGDDWLAGRAGVDIMDGGEDDDFLFGGLDDDIMDGGDGNDTLKGGLGADDMSGGSGADVFVFCTVADALNGQGEIIDDFVPGEDRLDFSNLVSGRLDLSINGSFTGAPSIRTFENSLGNTVVRVDADGDGSTDMRIDLVGTTGLTESDFAV